MSIPVTSTMTTLASSATQNSSSSSEGTMSTTPLATTTSEATSPITTPRTTEESTERSNGMDGGYIAAIAVGAVVVVVIVIVFLVVLIRRRRRKQKKPPPELPHPYPQAAALSMHPTLQQNGQRMPLTSQSSSGSIVADMPSEAYEDPETAAPRAVIQDIPKGSTKSQVYQNINRPSTQDMSDGVYVEPLGHRPPSERQPQGRAGKITSDSTYIAMGACGPPPSPQGEPTPPDQLDKEGERDEVYTVPNIHGSPPPIPCNGSKGPGYVNLPSPDVDGASLDDEQPLDDYQNVQTAVSPYRNISADASPQQPFSQVRRQLSSPASDPTAKKALKPPMPGNHGQRTPPKTSPKPAISPAHAFRSQSPALPSDTDSRPKNGSGAALAAVLTAGNAPNPSAKKKKKPAGASSSVHSPRPQPGTATDEESSDNESYENLPGTEQKRDYQNVPKKKTDPKHANGQQNNSSTSSSDSASTRQTPPGGRIRYQQKQQFPGALNDEFKKRMKIPK